MSYLKRALMGLAVTTGLTTAALAGAHAEDAMPTSSEPRRADAARSSGPASVAAERIARASGDFGRRAF